MKPRPAFLKDALRQGCLGWQLAQRAFATEGRYQVLRPSLLEFLGSQEVDFLPETACSTFLRRGKSTSAQTPGDPLSVYWADLQRLRPTSREEEFVLARAIDLLRDCLAQLAGPEPDQTIRALLEEHLSPYSRVLSEVAERPVGPRRHAPVRRRRLLQRLQELRSIQSALVDHNLHAVPATARRYRHVGVPWEDLIQEGNTALLRAVERYSRNEGVRFSSYAGWWVQQGVLKALSFQSRTVRLPVYLAQALHRVRDVQATSPAPLDSSELARRTGLSEDRVDRAISANRQCLSLNRTPGQDDEDQCMHEAVADTRPEPLPDTPTNGDLRHTLDDMLSSLPPREALVLRLRFGLEDGQPWTLEQVRQHLGISRERVRQLQAQSLRRLNRPSPRKSLARFM